LRMRGCFFVASYLVILPYKHFIANNIPYPLFIRSSAYFLIFCELNQ
jgi:hypothetical protein